MSKTILITGSNGFIGKHMVRYFVDNTDWNIIGADKDLPSGVFTTKRMVWWLVNLATINILRHHKSNFLSKGKFDLPKNIDYVIHLASEKNVKQSYVDILPFILSNVLGSARLFNWLKDKNCKKIINFSTAAVLGSDKINVTEDGLFDPCTPYGGSKAAQEAIASAYKNTYQLPIVNVRIDTPFGKGQPPGNFIPYLISKLLKNEQVNLYGKKDTGFTYCSRNWICVTDIAKHLHKILESDNQNTFHLLGNHFDIKEIYKKVNKHIGSSSKIDKYPVDIHCQTQDNNLKYSLGSHNDSTKTSKLTIDEFDERIKETVEWHIEQQEENK